jgi:DNA-binding HxlR family transcriptional regulator
MSSTEESATVGELFDATLLSPARLPIIVVLALNREADFTFLKKELGMSDGNLGANLRKLEEAGLMECKKVFVSRKPRSLYCLTTQGRGMLLHFITMMKKVEQSMLDDGVAS